MLFFPFFGVIVSRQFGVVLVGWDFSLFAVFRPASFGPGMVSQAAFFKCSDSLVYLLVDTVAWVVIWLTDVTVDRVHGVV